MKSSLFLSGLGFVLAAICLAVLLTSCGAPSITPPSEPPPISIPAPEPEAAVVGCAAGPGTWNANCPRISPTYLADVDAAINRVILSSPHVFDLTVEAGGGGFYVRDPDEFYRQVMHELRGAGFCAALDGDEIGVKLTNAFNDQFHVMTSSRFIRRGDSSYRSTCYPAWF